MADKADQTSFETWIADDLAAMSFPCAICGIEYSKHGLIELRQCFGAFAAALKERDNEIARLLKQP
jgi:hypothetical protein